MPVHVCGECRGRCWVSSSVAVQSSEVSLPVELTDSATQAGWASLWNPVSTSPALWFQVRATTLGFYRGAAEPNSGAHTSTVTVPHFLHAELPTTCHVHGTLTVTGVLAFLPIAVFLTKIHFFLDLFSLIFMCMRVCACVCDSACRGQKDGTGSLRDRIEAALKQVTQQLGTSSEVL